MFEAPKLSNKDVPNDELITKDTAEQMINVARKRGLVGDMCEDISALLDESDSPQVICYEAGRISASLRNRVVNLADPNLFETPGGKALKRAEEIATSPEYRDDTQKAKEAMTELREMLNNLL